MADLSLKEYENLILSSLEEAQQMDTKAQTEALMKKTGEDRKSWLSQFYDSLFGKTSEATIEPFQTEPLAPIVPDQAVMMEMAQIAAPLQNSPTLDMYQGMDVDNTEDVTQAQADRLRASLDAQIAMPTDSGATETTMVDVTESDMGKLSNEEPLYKMAEEIDPGTIETKGLMSKPQEFKIPEFKVFEDPYDMSELEILARTIEAEARGEAYKGKIAVGATIANRAASGSYGKGIRGVILRRGQFSPWNSWTGYAKGEQGKDMMKLKASEDSYKAANAILTGNYEDPTDGATHYVNEKVSKPAWLGAMKGRKRGTVTIGNHLFGNADSNKKYDGKSYIYGLSSETMDQPVEAEPPTVKAIQRIIGTKADGDFGPNSRKKAKEYLKDKGVTIPKDADDKTLMSLVVGG